MKEYKFKRGTKEITLKQVETSFAIRLYHGKAYSERALEASCGIKAPVKHLESVRMDKLDVFTLEEPKVLDKVMDDLRKSSQSEFVTHVYQMDDTSASQVIPTGTMTIRFSRDAETRKRNDILKKFGLEIIEELDFLHQGITVQLTPNSTINPLKIASKLQEYSEIEVVEPDLSFKIAYQYSPNDLLYRNQWHLNNRGDFMGLQEGADVKAEKAWNISRGLRDITVCVMDDGFDLEHPDFNIAGKIVAPRDFGQVDDDPTPVSSSDNHGTACAGVAIAEENGNGVVGLASGCSFMPIRTSGWISDQAIKNLFQYAIDNRADVISCSWSAAAWNFPLSTKITGIIHKAATEGRRNNKGCVILFAAGNENRPLDGNKDGVMSHQGFALHTDVMAVAASNSLDEKSDYSNYGPEIAICAPSSGSPGKRIVTTDRRGNVGYSISDYTYSFGGTSSSTPLAAGLAGLILSVDPDLSSAEVRQVMMDTADKIDQENGNYRDGYSEWYGHGRINAFRALQMVVGDDPQNRLPRTLFLEHRINEPIPDQGEAETRLTFPWDEKIINIEVSVKIRHTWSGDLRLTLKTPAGKELILQDRIGGSKDDVIKTFRSSDDPQLSSLIGISAQGDWRLEVRDMAQQDVGVINNWGLAITY